MEIERTAFGTITIDGKTYDHDVVIRLSGEIVKRKKKLSKKYYGTSHVLSKDEAKFVFEKGCERLIIGSGQVGNVHLSPEAEAYFAKKGCKVHCSRPTRPSICSTGQRRERSGFFTSPAEVARDRDGHRGERINRTIGGLPRGLLRRVALAIGTGPRLRGLLRSSDRSRVAARSV